MSHYKTLGVAETASPDEVKRAFRHLAMDCHPDHHPGDKAKEARFKEISVAYEVLGDHAKRADYDRRLTEQRAVPSPPMSWQTNIVPQATRRPSFIDILSAVLGVAAVAVPLIAVAAAGGGRRSPTGETGSDGRPLPPRGPDGRFRRG